MLEANPALCAMLARPLEQVLGARLHDFAHPDGRHPPRPRAAAAHRPRDHAQALRARRRRRPVGPRGRGQPGRRGRRAPHPRHPARTSPTRSCALAELAHRADHDDLTGLGNREALHRRLGRLVDEVRRGRRDGMGLLFLDLDRFKVVNDSLGHAVGDRLLRDVAARLRAGTPADDVLARLGGDEFAVVTGDADGAAALAERLVDALALPFDLDGREVTVGASIGIAVRTRRGSSTTRPTPPTRMLREADTAMYAAKRSGVGPGRGLPGDAAPAGDRPARGRAGAAAGAGARRAARPLPAHRHPARRGDGRGRGAGALAAPGAGAARPGRVPADRGGDRTGRAPGPVRARRGPAAGGALAGGRAGCCGCR